MTRRAWLPTDYERPMGQFRACGCGETDLSLDADLEAEARSILASPDPQAALVAALHRRQLEIARLTGAFDADP